MWRRRSFLMFDIAAGIGLVVAVLAGFSAMVFGLARLNDYTSGQRQVRAAAEQALHEVRMSAMQMPHEARAGRGERAAAAPGEPRITPDSVRIMPDGVRITPDGVRITITRTPGEGPWAGMSLITAEAARELPSGQTVVVQLSTYVANQGGRP